MVWSVYRGATARSLPTRTFTTLFSYDSWNRLISQLYPDGEIVSYQYDKGGNLKKISGSLNGAPYDYLKRVDYDHYEQRSFAQYGNNTETFYDYSPSMRRLQTLVVKASTQQEMMNNAYGYDKIGNITSLTNLATYSNSNGMGGNLTNTYQYDVLNRLTSASGTFAGDRVTQPPLGNDFHAVYTLAMTYSNTGRINTKNQWHELNGTAEAANTYQHSYSYIAGTHRVEQLTDENQNREVYSYDLNGNLDGWEDDYNRRDLFWDEANRLRVISANRYMQHYFYDASGERTMKASGAYNAVYINGQLVNNNITMGGYTTYPNGYITVDASGLYTKHYYIGSQRLASRMGDGTAAIFEGKTSDTRNLKADQQADLQHYAILLGVKEVTYKATPDYKAAKGDELEVVIYYYHPDHLGSNTFVTDMVGLPYQMFVNLPFGETMAEQTSTGYFQNPYKFNGKSQRSEDPDPSGELDAETGLYYYGARYYDPRGSLWSSVDPMMEKYAGWSPYNYTVGNPVMFVDPDGMRVDGFTIDKVGNIKHENNEGGDAYDVLYDKGAYDQGKRDYDETGNKSGVKINDKKLLKELQYQLGTSVIYNKKKASKDWVKWYEAKRTYSYEKCRYSESHSGSEASKVFYFAGKNTSVEWSFDRFSVDGQDIWAIGTQQSSESGVRWDVLQRSRFTFSNLKESYHSHPLGAILGASGYGLNYHGDRFNFNLAPEAPHFIFNVSDKTIFQYNNKKNHYNARPVNSASDIFKK